jgi:hypothetical protein
MTPAPHEAAVAEWRARREERLRDPDGWLTLVGLHWLAEGINRVGSAPTNDVVLGFPAVPSLAGWLLVERGAARWVPAAAGDEQAPGGVVGQPLAPDISGEPTVLQLGTLRMHVIARGDRLGLRVRDHASPALTAFPGMPVYPVDPSWRVIGWLEPAPEGSTLEIVDVTGLVSRDPSPGAFAFERDGVTWRIDALSGGEDGSLWLVFADATNGAETYGGGRFLYTETVAADGSVVADFNLAYNPPCVFTQFATCPLPPPQNRLALRIPAGELAYPPR